MYEQLPWTQITITITLIHHPAFYLERRFGDRSLRNITF
jgi:hypothetical protein